MGKVSWGVVGLFGFALVSAAQADVIETTPNLPPDTGVYVTSGLLFADYPGTPDVTVDNGNLSGFTSPTSTISGGSQMLSFGANFTGELSIGGGPLGAFALSGTVGETVLGRTSDTQLGSWTVEITSLDLSGTFDANPLEIMLDPSMTSIGTTSITPSGPSQFEINSFFDIFMEISLDGGAFVPQGDGPTALQLEATAIPEPASLALFALALINLGAVQRRKRKAT